MNTVTILRFGDKKSPDMVSYTKRSGKLVVLELEGEPLALFMEERKRKEGSLEDITITLHVKRSKVKGLKDDGTIAQLSFKGAPLFVAEASLITPMSGRKYERIRDRRQRQA